MSNDVERARYPGRIGTQEGWHSLAVGGRLDPDMEQSRARWTPGQSPPRPIRRLQKKVGKLCCEIGENINPVPAVVPYRKSGS